MRHIANVSGGKDSLAQILYILENDIPCDEVLFYDTGMEFQAIYNIFEKLKPLLYEKEIKFTTLHPTNPFLYDMLERPVESKQKGKHNGYGWCGGRCRWGTTWKTQALDKYAQGAIQYIGIAADEQYRRKELSGNKQSILIKNNMTEADCLEYCRKRGWNWHEESPSAESGYIDLYDILDRVSCWCCANKNRKELYNIYCCLPQYWERLRFLQSKLERPMKKFKNKRYGEYGNILVMEKVFEVERKEQRKCQD